MCGFSSRLWLVQQVGTMEYEEARKHMVANLGSHGWTCRICWILGIIFLPGVVAAAANTTLDLGSAN